MGLRWMRVLVRTWLFALVIGCGGLFVAVAPLSGQWAVFSAVAQAQTTTAPDFQKWEAFARAAEREIADARTSNLALEQLRAGLATWRSQFFDFQNAVRPDIEAVRSQIAALGPEPTDGTAEPSDIADRRKALAKTLSLAQAPSLAADEAYRRAETMIREIDRTLRDRTARELMQLMPSPLNPANWPAALGAFSQTMRSFGQEVANAWGTPAQQDELRGNLPLILAYLVFAIAVLTQGRAWVQGVSQRVCQGASVRMRSIAALGLSFGLILLPLLGLFALIEAVRLSGMVGLVGAKLLAALPAAGVSVVLARWLGMQIFPSDAAQDPNEALLILSAERRAEGRFHATFLGLTYGLEQIRLALFTPADLSEQALSVMSLPLLALAGVMVFRLGQLLRRHVQNAQQSGDPVSYSTQMIRLIGLGAVVIGALGPVLAAAGYIAAGLAMVFPATLTLGVIAGIIVLQYLAAELYALVLRHEERKQDALLPLLVGFGLAIASLPVLALIWGARPADLLEIWVRFNAGFSFGETRISPTNFAVFGLLFATGYGITRLLQGALRSSILPRTTLDNGGQNAVVAGVGYAGIFLAGLIAINAAGIDLSGLAIVAGALSVGIGFGLQNIVSNFVSGIILLIERPIGEGDWIEVGGVMGNVRSISVRSTRIETFDRTNVIVPNADLVSGAVTNWTRFNMRGRLIVPVGVAYGSDTRHVERVLLEIARAHPMVSPDPVPAVYLNGLGADSLNFEIRVILRDVNYMLNVRSDMHHEIIARFAQEGIEIPFAQRDLWLRNPEALQGLANKPAASGVAMPPEAT